VDYSFGNRMQRLEDQFGAAEVEARVSRLCSCYRDSMATVGLSEAQATETLERIVREDAYFTSPTPEWFAEFDASTNDAFKSCAQQASQPASVPVAPSDGADDITELVRLGCEAEGARTAAYCSCYGTEVNALTAGFTEPDSAQLLALMSGADRVMSTDEVTQLASASSTEARNEATQAALSGFPAIAERCENVQAEAPAETLAQDAPSPELAGTSGRDSFIAFCMADGEAEIASCECAADVMLTELTDGELNLMGAMQAAQSSGQNPVDAMMELGGLTQQEARTALAELAGRMSVLQQLGPQLASCG